MLTASVLAEALTPALVELVVPGADREAVGLEVVEPGETLTLEARDLVVGVGLRDEAEVLRLVAQSAPAAALFLRRRWAELPEVRRRCLELELPLLSVAEEVGWTSVLQLVRRALDAESTVEPGTGPGHGYGQADQIHSDLFEMADRVSALLGAPVTIEDPTSRVLAYSTGQQDVDAARMSTIFARQVPRDVRDRYRSRGVFRRLARSDEPFFVEANETDVKARYIVPVRAGADWLGSIWAVVDGPVPAGHERELKAAADVVALYLLRLRAQGELHRQIQLDQIRSLLRGIATEAPDWLDPGPWRVAALEGPVVDLTPQTRCELWSALARRHGWRQPLVADLDDAVYVVLRSDGHGAGSWAWFADLMRSEGRSTPAARLLGGAPVSRVADLAASREQANELGRLAPDALDPLVASIESSWPAVVLARAVSGLADRAPVSPLAGLLAAEGAQLVETLAAVIDHWAEPSRAAQALGVHPNTVRYRLARITELCDANLDNPQHRLALRIEIASWVGGPGARR